MLLCLLDALKDLGLAGNEYLAVALGIICVKIILVLSLILS